MSTNGKGSKRRQPSVKPEVFAENWEAVFGRKALPPAVKIPPSQPAKTPPRSPGQ